MKIMTNLSNSSSFHDNNEVGSMQEVYMMRHQNAGCVLQ